MNNREQSYFSAAGTLERTDFIKRLSATIFFTLFLAGYFWILSINYPALFILPAILCAIAIGGHTVAALHVIKRLRALEDNSKVSAFIFIPFFGVMYGLPSAMAMTDHIHKTTSHTVNTEFENAA